MARKPTEQAEIQELIQASAQARAQLGLSIGRLQRGLNVPARILGSMRHKPKSWLFGSMGAGLATSLLLSRIPRTKKKKKGKRFDLKQKALSLTLTAARPIVKVWLANRLRDIGSKWVEERVSPKPSPFKVEPDPKPEHVRPPGS